MSEPTQEVPENPKEVEDVESIEEVVHNRKDHHWENSEYVQDIKKENERFKDAAKNRTLKCLHDLLDSVSNDSSWTPTQTARFVTACDNVGNFKYLLSTMTESQMLMMLKAADVLGKETYLLFKSLFNGYILTHSVSEEFKKNVPEIFSEPMRTEYDPMRELKPQEKELLDKMNAFKASIKEASGYLDKEAKQIRDIRSKLIKNSGLQTLASGIKDVLDTQKQKEVKEVINQAEVDEMSKDGLRREVVCCMRELNWNTKVINEEFFNCGEKDEVEDVHVLLSTLEELIERSNYFKNVLSQLFALLIPGDLDCEEEEDLKEYGNGIFSTKDIKELEERIQRKADMLVAVERAAEANRKEKEQKEDSCACNTIQEEELVTKEEVEAEVVEYDEQWGPVKSASQEQEEQRLKLREQLQKVKEMSIKDLFKMLHNVANGERVSTEECTLIVAELKNRFEKEEESKFHLFGWVTSICREASDSFLLNLSERLFSAKDNANANRLNSIILTLLKNRL